MAEPSFFLPIISCIVAHVLLEFFDKRKKILVIVLLGFVFYPCELIAIFFVCIRSRGDAIFADFRKEFFDDRLKP